MRKEVNGKVPTQARVTQGHRMGVSMGGWWCLIMDRHGPLPSMSLLGVELCSSKMC